MTQRVPTGAAVAARAVFFCLAALVSFGGFCNVVSAQGGELSAKPSSFIARDLLSGLDKKTQGERRLTVESSLAASPSSAEVFVLALLDEASHDALLADPGKAFGPLDPGAAGFTYGGRGFVVETQGDGAALPGATVTIDNAKYTAARTGFVSPLILDLSFDGAPGVRGGRWEPHAGLDVTSLLLADINGDGFTELTEWVDGTDGLLVDPSDPSRVSRGLEGLVWSGSWSGRDLVGTAEGYRDGFEKLSLRDRNGNGEVSGDELAGLLVWQDLDRDAQIEVGELKTLAAWGVTSLRLPAQGTQVGSFVSEGRTGSLWDWWPSYALAKKTPAELGPQPPDQVDLFNSSNVTPAVELVIGPPADLDLDGVPDTIPRSALEAAGADWDSLVLLGVSPQGGRVILTHGGSTRDQVREGKVRLVWSIMAQDNFSWGMLVYHVPPRDIEQAVFASNDHLFLTGDGGGTFLWLNLAAGTGTVLHRASLEKPGFRAGNVAWAQGSRFRASFFDVFVEGYFYSSGQLGGPDVTGQLVLEEGGAEQLQVARIIKANTSTSTLKEMAGAMGKVRAHLRLSSELAHFLVTKPDGGTSLMTAFVFSSPITIEESSNAVLLRGIAASGQRVLFFRPSTMLGAAAGDVDALVADVSTGESRVLATGDFYYPYLEDEGRVAVIARIDWASGSMDFFSTALDGPMPQARAFEPLFSSSGIGTLRISKDGSTYAFLGPEGLRVGDIPRGPLGSKFLRGNANGSPLPAGEPRTAIDISDAISLLGHLFLGGPAPPCRDAADANDDGAVDISDAIKILAHLFGGGAADVTLLQPWPEPGIDPTEDPLGCETPQA